MSAGKSLIFCLSLLLVLGSLSAMSKAKDVTSPVTVTPATRFAED